MLSLLQRLFRHLDHPKAHRNIILLGLLLTLPCLASPLMADDYIQRIRLRPDLHYPGFDDSLFDLFVFASGHPSQRAALMDSGSFPWWTAEHFKLAFFRPLSVLTHWIDELLWGESSVLIHAHSLAWFAGLLGAVGWLYRRLHAPAVGALALLLYAIDDARGPVLSFAANRNAIIAAMLGVLVVILHDCWRRQNWRLGSVFAPALLGAALLAGESALATTAYLFAYALFLDKGSLLARVARLLPYAAVVVGWQLVYKALGYGAVGSGLYFHPTAAPESFLAAAVERWPVLMMGQLSGPPSDFWVLYPRPTSFVVLGLAIAVVGACVVVALPTLRSNATARFWALGAALAGIPVCAAFPSDRLLVFVSIGVMGLLACFLENVLSGSPSRSRRLVAGAVVLLHLILAPLALPVRSLSTQLFTSVLKPLDDAIPTDPSIASRSLVIVNAPADGVVAYIPIHRAVKGTPRPKNLRLLATGPTPLDLTRVNQRTLRLRPEAGFIATKLERMARSTAEPFKLRQVIQLRGMKVIVTRLRKDGRPAEAEFVFDRSLDDPTLLWMRWADGRLVPWTPPSVGQGAALPGARF